MRACLILTLAWFFCFAMAGTARASVVVAPHGASGWLLRPALGINFVAETARMSDSPDVIVLDVTEAIMRGCMCREKNVDGLLGGAGKSWWHSGIFSHRFRCRIIGCITSRFSEGKTTSNSFDGASGFTLIGETKRSPSSSVIGNENAICNDSGVNPSTLNGPHIRVAGGYRQPTHHDKTVREENQGEIRNPRFAQRNVGNGLYLFFGGTVAAILGFGSIVCGVGRIDKKLNSIGGWGLILFGGVRLPAWIHLRRLRWSAG